jgi:hypothetical protein
LQTTSAKLQHIFVDLFRKCAIWTSFKTQLEEKYRDFQIVGGMPEAVQSWVDTKSLDSVEKIQTQIIKAMPVP